MNLWVIVRDDGMYVAPPGQEKSYTRFLQDAWVFRYRSVAEENRCVENETVISLETALHGLR